MAFGPITLWHINGGKVEIVADFIFLGSKITVDSNCSYKIKRHLLLGRKTTSILKDRDIVSLTKVYTVKTIIFPVVMYGCESRTIEKKECQRMDAFELWCWRRFLRVPWAARQH